MNVPLRYRGAPMMALSSVFFAAMATLTRAASASLSAAQLVTGRFVVGLLVVTVIFAVTKTRPKITRPWLWVQRGLLGGAAVYFYFYAIEHLAVGPATLLNYMAAIYAAVFGVVFLKETAKPILWVGLLFATVGGAIVVIGTADKGTHFELSLGIWAGILSAILSGAAMTTIRALRRDTDAVTIFASFSLFGLLWAVPFSIANWKPVEPIDVLALLLIGGLAAAAQLLMTYAYGYVTASAGSVWTQFTPALAWGLGLPFLSETPNLVATLGALVVVTSILFGTGVLPHRRTAISSDPPSGA